MQAAVKARFNLEADLRQGLARFAASADDAGRSVMELLGDPAEREAMLRAQQEFRQGIDIASIVRFALDDGLRPGRPLPALRTGLCRTAVSLRRTRSTGYLPRSGTNACVVRYRRADRAEGWVRRPLSV